VSALATHVKICGVTSAEQALACVEAGASAIGVNFVASSPRRIDVARSREIARVIAGRALLVGVVADLDVDAMRALRKDAALGCLQLHGDEPPEALATLLPHAYKALRVGDARDVERAAHFPGEHILVDAKVAGSLGGTGHTFDWSLVRDLAKARKLTVAGGLTPDNVAAAIAIVHPYCVDVSSGVESGVPGMKDLSRARAFIAAVRRTDVAG
jgi:phosphoribosylanthranilate isomerase